MTRLVWTAAFGAILITTRPMSLLAQTTTETCTSEEGEQQPCIADPPAADDGSGDAAAGQSTSGTAAPQGSTAPQGTTTPPSEPNEPRNTWGAVEPGKGFLVGKTEFGDLYISVYALVRYLNQMPANQIFFDHLGRPHEVDPRNDIYIHRILVFLRGWIALPKLQYQIIFWTVNTTDQKAIFGLLGYQFNKKFNLYGGLNALPGTRSLQGSHPYWLGHDRVMADEFFRPYFSQGVWVNGELIPGFWYNVMVANNLSALGITAKQLTRQLATGGSVWWMPTTKEFGPRGAFGDWEYHERLATRFGFSTTRSREDRFSNALSNAPDNTTIRLADSINLFELGSLAPGVTVQQANYREFAVDAGMKYRGVFLQTELYRRKLSNFEADGPLPVTSIVDKGFYVQGAFFPVEKKIEVYGATSQIFGDKSAGFSNSNEYLGGVNFYLANSRNYRFNAQVIRVNRSPVSSSFGYYVGGQKGWTVALGMSIFF